LEGSKGSLKRLTDWHEKVGFGNNHSKFAMRKLRKSRRKGYESDSTGNEDNVDIMEQVTGINEPPQFVTIQKKPGRYCEGSQKDLDNKAMDALAAMFTPFKPDAEEGQALAKKRITSKKSPKQRKSRQKSGAAENSGIAKTTLKPLGIQAGQTVVALAPLAEIQPNVPATTLSSAATWAVASGFSDRLQSFGLGVASNDKENI
jgi:hypothetical protein